MLEPLSPDELAEAQRLVDAATPESWEVGWGDDLEPYDMDGDDRYIIHRVDGRVVVEHGVLRRADAEFIAASRTLLPRALAMIEKQGKKLEAVEGIHFSEVYDWYEKAEARADKYEKALREIRGRHVKVVAIGGRCGSCVHNWPCSTVELIDAALSEAPEPQEPEPDCAQFPGFWMNFHTWGSGGKPNVGSDGHIRCIRCGVVQGESSAQETPEPSDG